MTFSFPLLVCTPPVLQEEFLHIFLIKFVTFNFRWLIFVNLTFCFVLFVYFVLFCFCGNNRPFKTNTH